MPSVFAVLFCGCLLAGLAAAPVAASELFSYQPPPRGAPASLIGSGSRGANSADLALCLLAAPPPATTLQAQPVIYWFAEGEQPTPLRFTLRDPRRDTLLLTLTLTTPPAGAIQPIRLADHGITLEPDMDYHLTLTRLDAAPPLQVEAIIRRLYTPAILRDIPQRPPLEQAAVYAGAGIWYDAFAALSAAITARPAAALHQQRAALLEQVELPRTAAYDLRRAAALR